MYKFYELLLEYDTIIVFLYSLSWICKSFLLIISVINKACSLILRHLRSYSKLYINYENILMKLFILLQQFDKSSCKIFNLLLSKLEYDHVPDNHQHLIQNSQPLSFEMFLFLMEIA